MATNTSTKYDDITFKTKVQSGSPNIYHLKPKTDNIGALKRFTVGEKCRKNKTILLVGETGAGKSTLINALVNYAMGVTWEDDVWFQIVEDETEAKNQNHLDSRTSGVIIYQVFGFEGKTLPYSLTIIDTPGYGDTRGIEHDDIISQQLLDLFRSEDGVHEVNAVGLVLKASVNRLSERMSYIFDSVVSLFGKDLEKNIVALVTFSNGRTPKDVLAAVDEGNVRCARKDNQVIHFLFDNCQHEDRTEDRERLKSSYEITADGMKKFLWFLRSTEPQKLKKTVNVLKERIRLSASIQNLQERVELIELQQREIQQTQESLRKYEEEMKENQNFTVEVDEAYRELEPIRGGWHWLFLYEAAVSCTVCEENCHYPGCTVAHNPSWCEVMKDGCCTVCTNKCPVPAHKKETKIYVNKTRKVQKTKDDIKEKYETSKSDHDKKTQLLRSLNKKLDKLQKNKDQYLVESFQHVVKLERIALQADSLSTVVHLNFLIEKMKEKGDAEKLQKLEEMRRRLDKGTRRGLRYMVGQFRVSGKEKK